MNESENGNVRRYGAPGIAALLGFGGLIACALQSAPALVIRNVTVVNPVGPALPNQSIVVRNARVAQVGPAGAVRVPRAARTIDARGLYAIPGLWDMHVHTVGRGSPTHYAGLFLANGVTGVRDMGDDLRLLRALRDSIARGTVLAPRLVFGGRIDAPGPRPGYALSVARPADVPQVLDSLMRARVDFVKVPASLPLELYDAIMREAHRRGLRVAGHVPFQVSMTHAAEAGQASIEHEDDLMAACGTRELAIKQRIAAAARTDDLRLIAPVMRAAADSLRAARSDAQCGVVARTLARHRTWFTPTLIVYQPYARGFDSATVNDARLAHVPQALRQRWQATLQNRTAQDFAAVTAYFDLERTALLHRAGVRFLAGTDTPLPYVIPGFSLHDELELLTRAGLTPQQALQAATSGPAEFLGMDESFGSIQSGKIADFVLLSAHPLSDIRNTRRVAAVVFNGRYLDRAALDRLLPVHTR